MAYLLNLAYLLALALLSPWLLYKAVRQKKYRHGWKAKLLGRAPECRDLKDPHSRPRIWLHAVSVGEVNLLGVLLDELANAPAPCECVLSTTTATGFAVAKQKYPRLVVIYAPLDFSWAVRAALRRINPSLLILCELELWPNLIDSAKQHGAKVAVVNGRLSDRSFRGYRRLRWWIGPLLRQIDCIAAQTEEYANRFLALGAPPKTVHVTGSLKFEGALPDRQRAATDNLRALAGIGPHETVFVAGSTHEPEEALAIEVFRALAPQHPRLRLILVPRHPERFPDVAHLLARSGLPWRLRSELDNVAPTASSSGPSPTLPILLVDTVGELSAWWGLAAIGFVGGSLGSRGGQNMLEPAACGVAVCFGPQTRNFRDIVALLLANRAAEVVADGRQLCDFVRRCLEHPAWAKTLGDRAAAVVACQRGATRRTADLLWPLLKRASGPSPSRAPAPPQPHFQKPAQSSASNKSAGTP